MNTSCMNNSRLVAHLSKGKKLLLDGGMSNQLEDQGFDLNNALWSAHLLLSQPEAIVEAHRHYLDAGAQCLITTSYQASISGLINTGLTQDEAVKLIISSVTLAQQAVNEYCLNNPTKERPFVAASVGPYGAYLADGSEYNGHYNVTDDVLRKHHKAQISILSKTDADLMACETVPSLQEALVLRELLAKEVMPAWISFSCKNGQQLNDGTPIEDCVELFKGTANPVALGVNCTNPKYIVELVQRIKAVCPEKFIVVYPNSGEDYDATTKTWHGTATPGECGHASEHWLNAGANIIGGCCRMGPEHISSIKNVLDNSL